MVIFAYLHFCIKFHCLLLQPPHYIMFTLHTQCICLSWFSLFSLVILPPTPCLKIRWKNKSLNVSADTHTHTHIYMCVCACMPKYITSLSLSTNIYIYIYIYIDRYIPTQANICIYVYLTLCYHVSTNFVCM